MNELGFEKYINPCDPRYAIILSKDTSTPSPVIHDMAQFRFRIHLRQYLLSTICHRTAYGCILAYPCDPQYAIVPPTDTSTPILVISQLCFVSFIYSIWRVCVIGSLYGSLCVDSHGFVAINDDSVLYCLSTTRCATSYAPSSSWAILRRFSASRLCLFMS